MCLLCKKTFSNNAMKLTKMRDYLERIYSDEKNKNITHFKMLKEKLKFQSNLNTFQISSANADSEGGLKISYSIYSIAKKEKTYTNGKEIILPAIKNVIKNVLKKDHQQALKCILLNANTVQ